jgi:hypothetical protein
MCYVTLLTPSICKLSVNPYHARKNIIVELERRNVSIHYVLARIFLRTDATEC